MKRIITTLCLSLLITTFSHAQSSDRPDIVIPPEVQENLNQIINEVSAALIVFSSGDAVASGYFKFDVDGQQDSKLDVLKIYGDYALGNESDRIRPFISGTAGMVSYRELVPPEDGIGESDFGRFYSTNLGIGGGAIFSITDGLSITPGAEVSYNRIENKWDYNNPISQQFLSLFDGQVFNWNLESISYLPSVKLAYNWKLTDVTITPSTKYSHMFTESFSSSSDIYDLSTDSGILRSMIELSVPTSCFENSLTIKPYVARTDISRDAEHGLGFSYLHEFGIALVADVEGTVPLFKNLGLSTSYTVARDLTGVRFGIVGDLN